MNSVCQNVEFQELWTLSDVELSFVKSKVSRHRLIFAALLKFFQIEGRFPDKLKDIPQAALQYLSQNLGISLEGLSSYKFLDRTNKWHRARIREFLGHRPATTSDEKEVEEWLYREVITGQESDHELLERLRGWYRSHKIEQPGLQRQKRVLKSAITRFESGIFQDIYDSLPDETRLIFKEILDENTDESAEAFTSFQSLKSYPGKARLKTVLAESDKIRFVVALNLKDEVFKTIPEKRLQLYRRRAEAESIWELRRHPTHIGYALMAIFCYERKRELTDDLIDAFTRAVYDIQLKAQKSIDKKILREEKAVHGKSSILYKLSKEVMNNPAVACEKLFDVVSQETLQRIIEEYEQQGAGRKYETQTTIRHIFSRGLRRMLPSLFELLTFRCNNTHHQPVIEAITYLKSIQHTRKQKIDINDVPIDGIVPKQLKDFLLKEDHKGNLSINRIHYETCVMKELRERLRCKEIWVEGAHRYGNPDEDLPQDFERQRTSYYQQLDLPLNADEFITRLKKELRAELDNFNRTLPNNSKVKLREHGSKLIKLTPLQRQPEPIFLGKLKEEISDRWQVQHLLDVMKEADLRIGFTNLFKGLGNREIIPREDLQRRLLLCLYGIGTNAGLKRVLGADTSVTYEELRYTKQRYIYHEAVRSAIVRVAEETLKIRHSRIWGEGTTTCASDSTKFGAWDQNLMSEWHVRYGGRGVSVYWHVEKNALCIHSKLDRCSSSEVAPMIHGVLFHDIDDVDIQRQYVDSHGQSEVGFAFCHLLGFDLMPRLKGISREKLVVADLEDKAKYPNLTQILKKNAIDWEKIRQQYDQLVQNTAAMKNRTAEPETILRRFTADNRKHPTYQALIELGKVVKTIFLCRYLSSEALRQEIQEGLNVVENSHSANDFIFFGKGGEIASNIVKEQELSVLCLHLLQVCMTYINTLMIQEILSEPRWFNRMKKEDWRGLNPLIYGHLNPYGAFELDMRKRLLIKDGFKMAA